tara:strand:+ start:3536 stop:4393 length:858 start_codon:yes stop_codon:yes gene_type:complete
MQANNKKLKLREIPFQPSTIEGIDTAMFEHIDQRFDIHCTTRDGFKKVPVVWISSERAYQRKHNKELMTPSGSINLPIMTLERVSLTRDKSAGNMMYSNIPGVKDEKQGSITIARRINQKKTSNFANADSKRLYNQRNFRNRNRPNEKVVYETITIPNPVFVEVNYSLSVIAEYQQQINEIVIPFIAIPGRASQEVVRKNGHSYEVFVDGDYKQDNNIATLEVAERQYKTTISFKVLAYLIGSDKNQKAPKMVIRENAVEVKIPRERVILGDIQDHIGKKGFYRE